MNRHIGEPTEREQRFETLVRQHSRPVLAYCLRRGAHADAHEAAADAFAVAWRKFDQVPAGEEALYWLLGVARRVLSNQQRSPTAPPESQRQGWFNRPRSGYWARGGSNSQRRRSAGHRRFAKT